MPLREDRLEWYVDDLKAACESIEREGAEVIFGDSEKGRGLLVTRELERLGNVREQVAQRRSDCVRLVGMPADGFAEKPDAVADVSRLVVVDLRVALDEAGKEFVPVEGIGDELERR